MKITLVSEDKEIINTMQNYAEINKLPIVVIYTLNDSLELVSKIVSSKPNILIIDDDLVHPHSLRVIKAVSSIVQNISLIFLTSTLSVELGREISPLGVDFYGIKPIDSKEFEQVILSIINNRTKNYSMFN